VREKLDSLAELQRFENAGVFGAVIYVGLFGNVIQIHKKKRPLSRGKCHP
jgi:hypothetical protein